MAAKKVVEIVAQFSAEGFAKATQSVKEFGTLVPKSIEKLNKALVGAGKLTEQQAAGIQKAFRDIANDSKGLVATSRDLRVSQRKLAEQMLQSGISFDKVASVFRKTEDELRRFLKISPQRFAQELTNAGFSAETLAQKLGITTTELEKLMRATSQTSGATKKASKSWTGFAKKIGLWTIGAASAFRAYMALRRALLETFETLNKNTEEYKELQSSIEGFKGALVGSIGTSEDIGQILRWITGIVETAGKAFVISSAAIQASLFGWINMVTGAIEVMQNLDLKSGSLQETMAMFGEVATDSFGNGGVAAERFNEVMVSGAEAMATMRQEIEKTGDSAQSIDSLANAILRWNASLEETEMQLQEINDAFATAGIDSAQEWRDDMFQIFMDLQNELADIDEDAQKARDKAAADNAKKRLKNEEKNNDAIEKARAQHELKMRQMQQRFSLTMIQNERVFQAARRQLVAEGDVLGIEQLEERHALEEQAREEDFRLQQQQAQATFELQLKFMKKASQEQARLLASALANQLRDIEAARQERIAEANEAANEERGQALEAHDDRLDDAHQALQDELADMEDMHSDMVNEQAQFFLDLFRETDLGAEEIVAVAEATMGPNGEMANAIRRGFTATESAVNRATSIWETATARQAAGTDIARMSLLEFRLELMRVAAVQQLVIAQGQVSGAGTSRIGGGRPGGTRFRQFGGEDVVSRPTTFVAGEGHSPERVSVTPLSPIGNTMTLSWAGDPIPVHGTGQLNDLDTGGLSDAITQGIMTELTRNMRRLRGQR